MIDFVRGVHDGKCLLVSREAVPALAMEPQTSSTVADVMCSDVGATFLEDPDDAQILALMELGSKK